MCWGCRCRAFPAAVPALLCRAEVIAGDKSAQCPFAEEGR
ncbi:hypothetical protein EDWATA_02548 [Edwardsiella tarda ATCC 23685]|uniref:Uncharacterized protein n=1 Tax=Edwardsiella tarda ATCC 23685 TaxID=500638 RepID=D4F714_EDWTA|nr:hypothetical protein EDWATA_02548 [Edwardsiella tarda ATCC 23685]